MSIDRYRRAVVGVMPEGFGFPDGAEACPGPSSRETSSPVSAAALSPGLESALCGVAPLDPASFAAAAFALLATALVSCLVPARRAASLDPAVTLRLD